MNTSDKIYLFLMAIFIGGILGSSIFYICEGEFLWGFLGIILAITDAFDAWYHVTKWNKLDDRINRIRKK